MQGRNRFPSSQIVLRSDCLDSMGHSTSAHFLLLAQSQFSIVGLEIVGDGFWAISRSVDLDSDQIANSRFVLLWDGNIEAVDDCTVQVAFGIIDLLVCQVYGLDVLLLLRCPSCVGFSMCAWIWLISPWLVSYESVKLILLDQT